MQKKLFDDLRKCPYCGNVLKFKGMRVYEDNFVDEYERCSNVGCRLNDKGLDLKYGGFCFEGIARRATLKEK